MPQPNHFDTAQEFVVYLKNTLIPGLRESGYLSTAEDFEEAVHWIKRLQKGATK